MTRPRRSFGQQPGRLAATMLRALSAELSEPGRYSRGKGYARDGAVIDIEIVEGKVMGQVLGSRREPYEVTLYADPAATHDVIDVASPARVVALIPERTELSVACTCPDGGGTMCKHAIALLLVLADEVSIEPELLARWRGGRATIVRRDVDHIDHTDRVDQLRRVDVLASMLPSPSPLPTLPAFRRLAPHRRTTPRAAQNAATDLVDRLLAESLTVIARRPRRSPSRTE